MDMKQNSTAGIQDIFASTSASYMEKYPVVKQQRKAIYAITNCRGPLMGRHIDKCDRCGHLEISYNSCRNRHCPRCQQSKQQEWVNHLAGTLPPVRYFHLVFTLPHELNEMVFAHQQQCYPILFRASAQAVLQITSKPGFLGAQTGCLSVLHTWGQNLQYHPHIHMLVPAGGLSEDLVEWLPSGKKFFAPVKVLSKVFRGKFISMLEELVNQEIIPFDLAALKPELYKKDWVVYSKKTFAGPGQVLQYLGRYTHRVAISDSRIVAHHQGKVIFRWKDYRDKSQWKLMQLDSLEFMRRFLLHVLPANFYKIRYYGILSLAGRKQKLKYCFDLIRQQNINLFHRIKTEVNMITVNPYKTCPVCHVGVLKFYAFLLPRAV